MQNQGTSGPTDIGAADEMRLTELDASVQQFFRSLPTDRFILVFDKQRRLAYVVVRMSNPITPREAWRKLRTRPAEGKER